MAPRGYRVDLLVRFALLRQRTAGDVAFFPKLMQSIVDLRTSCIPDEICRARDRSLQVISRRWLDREQTKKSESKRHVIYDLLDSLRSFSLKYLRPTRFQPDETYLFIDIGSLAQAGPLPGIMTANDRSARGFDTPDLRQRFHQCISVPGVARDDTSVERLAQTDGVAGEQEHAASVELCQRAYGARRVAG